MIHYTSPVDRLLNLLSGKALWFMPCLIIAEIVWFYIHKVATNNGIIVLLGILMGTIGMMLAHFHILRYAMFNTALVVQLYFVLGFSIKKWEKDMDRKWKQWVPIALTLFILLGTYVLTLGSHRSLDVHMNRYPNFILCMIMIILGCSSLFTLFRKANVSPKWLAFIGQNTLAIYLLHGIMLFLINGFCESKGLDNYYPLPIWAFFKTIIACLVCCVFAETANRYVPELVGKKRKKNSV